MEGFTLFFGGCVFALVSHHLMSELFLQSIDILLGILELKFDFLADAVGKLIEIYCNKIEDLFLIDLIGNFYLIVLIIEGFIEVDLVIVSFSLFVGEVIDIYAHC